MSERITALESVLKKLEPVENILERMDLLEKSIYSTKRVFTFQDACMYIGVSDRYAVQTHGEQRDSALQAAWQNDLLCQGRTG